MRSRNHASVAVMVTLLVARAAWAGGLGIPLDGFLTLFVTFVTGLGTLIFLLGLGSYVYQWVRHEAW
jgi:hypothetical protein